MDVGERLPVGVADDEAILAEFQVRIVATDQGGGKRRTVIECALS
jgi:chemotaxis receptor (MCP) glutamine deamidase CheD